MRIIKKMMLITALALGMKAALALPSIRLETAPTENQGTIEADDLNPAFSRPLAEEAPAAAAAPAPAPAPKQIVEAKNEKKNDILSLFRDEQQPKKEEVNPLEEQARNEMKIVDDPEGKAGDLGVVQIGENNRQPELDIKPENAPKEIELDAANGDSKNLPGMK